MSGFTRFGSACKPLAITIGIVLAVVAGWVVLSHVHAARPCKEVSEVAGHISRQLQSGVAVVDMGRATDFPWDEMFVFNPYYPKDGICKALKLRPHECSEAHISDVDEGEFLLVFMLRGGISETVRLPRTIANFEENDRCIGKAIVKSVAVFKVERKPAVYLVCR